MQIKVGVGLTIDKELLAKIDDIRGTAMKRSAYIRMILQKHVDGIKETKED